MTNPTLVDETIGRLESLQESLGGTIRTDGSNGAGAIPPERDPVEFIEEQMDRLLAALGKIASSLPSPPTWEPPMTAWTTVEGELVVWLDVAGARPGCLEISLGEGGLIVEGRRTPPATFAEPVGVPELLFGRFRRVVALSPTFAAEKVVASVRDGILELRLPPTVRTPERRRSLPISWTATS